MQSKDMINAGGLGLRKCHSLNPGNHDDCCCSNFERQSSKVHKKFQDHNSKMQEFIQHEREIYEDQTFQSGRMGKKESQARKQDDFWVIDDMFTAEIDMEKWTKEKEELVALSNKDIFSNSIKLSQKELKAEKKLFKLRDAMLEEDMTVATGFYYDKLDKLKSSALYECLNIMPKTVVHHIHLTAAAPISFLVEKLCYYDFVYFNQKDQMFKVSKNGCDLPGYVKVNHLRQYWESSVKFDKYLHDSILLREGTETQEHHEIWKYFQPKFMMTLELYNYASFFEIILYRVSKNMVKQCVSVIEWKHIFGMVFDEEGPIGVERECAIFNKVQKDIQNMFPLFQMRIVVCGLKIVGKDHIQSQIDATFEAKKYTDMIIGFDMVNEEDFTPEIDFFMPQMYEAKAKAQAMGETFDVYLHCGESNSRENNQLYDAILLDTKRIGHGFHLAYHPELQKIVKEKEICIECCPVSNFVLGYVLDLRCHPARGFLHQGLPVTISPDDPGFMGYEGVTLDYLYVFICWELDIADLKQLVINSIKYSSVKDSDKADLTQFFEYKWNRFLDYVIAKY